MTSPTTPTPAPPADPLAQLVDGLAERIAVRAAERVVELLGQRTSAAGLDADLDGLLTYGAAAAVAGCSADRLRRAAAAHELDVVRYGPSSVRIPRAALERWISRHRVDADGERPRLRRVGGAGR